jgi:hypothetical protein
MQGQFDTLTHNINGLLTQIEHLEQRPPPEQQHHPRPNLDGELDDEDDDEVTDGDRDVDRLRRNRFQMGGSNHGNNDPFAKVKFTMIPFAGNADPEAYLDWDLAVDQKFNSHQVPPEHRVRLATNEFTCFALFWWNGFCNANNVADVPQTWNVLKCCIKFFFVPPYFQRDLCMKLQTLKQGDKSVEEYYQELLIPLPRCGIHEDVQTIVVRFFGGLNHDIHDILDYKELTWFGQ